MRDEDEEEREDEARGEDERDDEECDDEECDDEECDEEECDEEECDEEECDEEWPPPLAIAACGDPRRARQATSVAAPRFRSLLSRRATGTT